MQVVSQMKGTNMFIDAVNVLSFHDVSMYNSGIRSNVHELIMRVECLL